jgi:hypothetical protein
MLLKWSQCLHDNGSFYCKERLNNTEFQDPMLNGASVVPTSEACTAAILVLHTARI